MPKVPWRDLMLIFAGGGTGALVRSLADFASFGPFMAANFAACLMIGLSTAFVKKGFVTASWYIPLVHTGFLGGLSTFSVLSIAAWVWYETPAGAAAALFGLLFLYFLSACAGYGLGLAVLKMLGHRTPHTHLPRPFRRLLEPHHPGRQNRKGRP